MKNKITALVSVAVAMAAQVLQPLAVEIAFNERGYFAMGGEWVFNAIGISAMFFTIQAVMNMADENKKVKNKYVQALYRNVFNNLKSGREERTLQEKEEKAC